MAEPLNETEARKALYQACVNAALAGRGSVRFDEANELAKSVGLEGARRLVEEYGGAARMELLATGYWRNDH